jgi:hypothetical protein
MPTLTVDLAPMSTSQMNTDAIPSGSWTLWYHSPKETRWTAATYKSIATISTWTEFWSLVDAISDEAFLNGFFFFMRDPAPPLWENKLNIRGGSYSLRIGRKDSADIFYKYVIGAMMGNITADPANKLMGVTISPKRGFNVINVWNEDSSHFNGNDGLNLLTRLVGTDELRYLAHRDKNFG